MEVDITKMSRNGQVVIPAGIRKRANLKPSSRFLVFEADDTICLKRIDTEDLEGTVDLIKRIESSEKEIKKGKSVKADTKMSESEIDDLLMGD